MRLLVVDDNNLNQLIVIALLRKFNYDILTASNGIEALEMFKSDKFDCILMDIHMPKMDGITSTMLIREFEKENNLNETPILALTASHPEEDKSKCLDAGMNDFIRKPVRQEELSRIISIFADTNTSEKKLHMKLINDQSFNESFSYFDKEIVVEIIDIFLNEYEERLSTIKKAIEEKDFSNLKFHAHSLKGVVANFSAPKVQAIAKELEDKGTNSIDENLNENFEELDKLIRTMAEEITVLRENYV